MNEADKNYNDTAKDNIRNMVSDLIEDVSRQLILSESERRQKLSKSNFPLNGLEQTNCFVIFRDEGILNLWLNWFVQYADPTINTSILENYNLLIQNMNREEEHANHLFQHELFHALVTQRGQTIIDVLNDLE